MTLVAPIGAPTLIEDPVAALDRPTPWKAPFRLAAMRNARRFNALDLLPALGLDIAELEAAERAQA